MSRHIEYWTTVQVIPVTGYVNVFEVDGKYEAGPCPAFLLQEHRMSERVSNDYGRNPNARVEDRTTHKSPYETRVVTADIQCGEVIPCDAQNYMATVTRAEFDQLYGEKAGPTPLPPAA